jgi:hypothetical protein
VTSPRDRCTGTGYSRRWVSNFTVISCSMK